MQLDKNRIQQLFNLASFSYDDVANVQEESAEILVNKLIKTFPDFYPSSILDVGAGTGYVSEALFSNFPLSNYTLNDISPVMLERAKEKFASLNQFKFLLDDMEVSNFDFHDLVVSNFALQWANELEETIKTLYNNSNVLAFSCLLEGTFKEWALILQDHDLPSPLHRYPSQANLEDFLLSLKPSDYSFETRDYEISFDNAKTFIEYLKRLGANNGSRAMPLNAFKKFITTHNHQFKITYKVFWAIIKRA